VHSEQKIPFSGRFKKWKVESGKLKVESSKVQMFNPDALERRRYFELFERAAFERRRHLLLS
jgi:hypothetical protein